jgi:hypothetical protein
MNEVGDKYVYRLAALRCCGWFPETASGNTPTFGAGRAAAVQGVSSHCFMFLLAWFGGAQDWFGTRGIASLPGFRF